MSCAYCITNQFHMVVILRKDGTYHVHAPFHDKRAMFTMLKAVAKEQKNWDKKNG